MAEKCGPGCYWWNYRGPERRPCGFCLDCRNPVALSCGTHGHYFKPKTTQKNLVKRGRAIPEPTPDKMDNRPVYKVQSIFADADDRDYGIKRFYWNCAVCGKEFVARRDAKHCALFHCPKCKIGSLVWVEGKLGDNTWVCKCGYYTYHNPEFGSLLEKDETDADEAQEAADQGYIDYTKHETPEEE